jgi:hypothetical protein
MLKRSLSNRPDTTKVHILYTLFGDLTHPPKGTRDAMWYSAPLYCIQSFVLDKSWVVRGLSTVRENQPTDM